VDGAITTPKIADGAVTTAKLEHSGPHIPITPDENGLVKMAVLRQDDTTDSYSNNQVVLTGWGFKQGAAGTNHMSETINFGVTFSDYPIVVVSLAGRNKSGDPSDLSDVDDECHDYQATAYDIQNGQFTITIYHTDTVNFNTNHRFLYTWIAIGTLE
jgi:hypothetical protein